MTLSRRDFLGIAIAGAASSSVKGVNLSQRTIHRIAMGRIDRKALAARHNPVLRAIDPLSPLSVGNGEFAFTADVTGLQTFPDVYGQGLPLCTMSQWGWYTGPSKGFDQRALCLTDYDTFGLGVGFSTSS